MQIEVGDLVRIKHTDYRCGLDVGTVHPVQYVFDRGVGIKGTFDDGDQADMAFYFDEVEFVSRATPAEPEIEWGEWGDFEPDMWATYQFQKVNGVEQWRYPVPKQPIVETVTLHGGMNLEGTIWLCSWPEADASGTATVHIRDGKPDWSTLRGEDM